MWLYEVHGLFIAGRLPPNSVSSQVAGIVGMRGLDRQDSMGPDRFEDRSETPESLGGPQNVKQTDRH